MCGREEGKESKTGLNEIFKHWRMGGLDCCTHQLPDTVKVRRLCASSKKGLIQQHLCFEKLYIYISTFHRAPHEMCGMHGINQRNLQRKIIASAFEVKINAISETVTGSAGLLPIYRRTCARFDKTLSDWQD